MNAETTLVPITPDTILAREMARFVGDPLGFVLFAYPWGRAGTELEHEMGPDPVQKKFLTDLGEHVKRRKFRGTLPVMPIMMTATSGHGTGKSVLGAWIGDWILSTRPDSIGTVTAGTFTQLEIAHLGGTPALDQAVHHRALVRYSGARHLPQAATEDLEDRRADLQGRNAQAFAGQHARTSTSWYMFDEASLIPDKVWTVAQGGLTDGQPMFFAWGQMERNTGRFYEINFGNKEHRWNHRTIDSRESRFTNKALIAQDLLDYGEDSDYFRVRVRGLAPTADELQFIDRGRILTAQQRDVVTFSDEPLIAGFDASGGGSAWNVIRFRRGLDARNVPAPIRIPGEQSRDRSALLGILSELMKDERPAFKVAMMFVDSAYGAPYVERLHLLGFANVIEVNFGAASPDRHQANMRAYMWNLCRRSGFCAAPSWPTTKNWHPTWRARVSILRRTPTSS